MLKLFTFVLDEEGKGAAWSGNITPLEALSILHNIVIMEEVKKAVGASPSKLDKEAK